MIYKIIAIIFICNTITIFSMNHQNNNSKNGYQSLLDSPKYDSTWWQTYLKLRQYPPNKTRQNARVTHIPLTQGNEK